MELIFVVAPLILIAVVLAAVFLDRWGVPVILVALCVGITFGSDLLNLWYFDDFVLVNRIATFSLVVILFHGGFSTKLSDVRAVAILAGGLATWGVVLTAGITYAILHFALGWSNEISLLLAVIISSTDAAAIFSILRRQPLPQKLSSTVEIESAANDPMAIVLTVAALDLLTSRETLGVESIAVLLWKFIAAFPLGWGMAKVGIWIFNRLSLQDRGHYYVLSLGLVLLLFGVAEAMLASGMLAVFIAGLVLGNSSFVHKQGIANFSSALATIANIGMFVLLGLQVFPHQWSTLWVDGLVLFVVICLLSRPLAVWLSTLGMNVSWRERLFVAWAGIRGSAPIVLATYPAARGMAIGQDVFNLTFFAVLLSVAIQGGTLSKLSRILGLRREARPQPLFNLELVTMSESDYDLITVDIPGSEGAPGKRIADLGMPHGAVITLVTRNGDLIVPSGQTQLLGWDQVTVLAHAGQEADIRRVVASATQHHFDAE